MSSALPWISVPACGRPRKSSPSAGSMALRLLLLRHAETDWNREGRYQGWTDTDLSAVGRGQAEAAGRLLARQPLAAVWSSPLRRARDTAAAIADAQGLAGKEHDALNGMRVGGLGGV